MYIYTTFDERTTKRRAGSPAARSSSEFSTALAGGRGAASASTASRSQAPRGGSSAPPVWSRPSSACPTPTLSEQRRSPRTVAASQRVSCFGRALAACEGGIESRVRARGVGRSSGQASNVCRPGRGRPKPAVLITSMPLYVAAEPSFSVGCSHAGLAAVKSLLKGPRCSQDAGAVRSQAPNNSERNR